MSNQNIRAVAVGAANIDVHGFPGQPLVMRDSNPGHIRTCPGGVARNIAENLARLGVPVALITALGDDAGGASLRASCRELGIRLDRSVEVPGHPSSTYMAIMDEEGDMALGLSDMRILDHVTPEHLESCAPLLSEADVVAADACLTTETLERLVNGPCAKVFIDPVSIGKCRRMERLLGRFYCVKMNRMEAAYLAGMSIETGGDLDETARRMLASGVKKLYITLGAEGVFFAEEGNSGRVPAIPLLPVNATGAGDAFTAAAVYGELHGWTMERTARFAVKASALTLLSRDTVSERMSMAAVEAVGGAALPGDKGERFS